MGFLERLENLIQGAVEGSASTALRQKIKPVEIENQLERAMRDNTQPSRGGRLAPNSYVVRLHPDTFRETIAGVEGYNRHCELLLNQFASQQGYTLLQPRISVAFDTDAALGRRDIRVESGFDTPPPSTPPARQPLPQAPNITHTQVIHTPVHADSASHSSQWSLQVLRGRNAHQTMTIPFGESMIGRSRECDLVLQDERNTVSRQHAVFINHGDELRLRDNGSKNGTRVNGNYVPYHAETRITDGAEIAFGECVVRVQAHRRQENW